MNFFKLFIATIAALYMAQNALASSTSAATGPSEEEQKKSSQQLQATPANWRGSFTVKDLKGIETTLTRSPGGLDVSQKDLFNTNLRNGFRWISLRTNTSQVTLKEEYTAEQFYVALGKVGTVVDIQPPALAESLWFHNGKSCFGTFTLNDGEIAFSRVISYITDGFLLSQGNNHILYENLGKNVIKFSKDENYGGVFKPAADFDIFLGMTAKQLYEALRKGGKITNIDPVELAEHVGWVKPQAQGAVASTAASSASASPAKK